MSTNVTEIRPGAASAAPPRVQDAEECLIKARALLEVANDLFGLGDAALKESVTDYMSGYLWCVLEHVRAAQEVLASTHSAGEAS